MAKTYEIVIPNEDPDGDPSQVAEFDNKDDAIEFAMKEYGANNQGYIKILYEFDEED